MAVLQHLRMDCVHGELQCLPTQLTCPGECSPGGFGEEGARCFHCSSPSPGEPVHPSPMFVSLRGSCWLEMVTGAKPPPTPQTRDLKEPLSSKPSRYISFPPSPPLPCPPSQPVCSTDPLSPLFLAQYGYEGRVPLKSARLFYDISEKARRIVESYFMLNSTLYFSYTHLVCRTALSGEGLGGRRRGRAGRTGGLQPPKGGFMSGGSKPESSSVLSDA